MPSALAGWVLDRIEAFDRRLAEARARRRWDHLRAAGMHIGTDVELPMSTWIDSTHAYLIHIGDGCRFGPHCLMLAHDGQMDEYLDAGRIGRVVIGDGCIIGARTVILCNVEIGPGCVIEAGSVVATSLPAGSYCAGAPARAVSTVEQYAARVRETMGGRPTFTEADLRRTLVNAELRRQLLETLAAGPAFVRTHDPSAGTSLPAKPA